MSLVTNVNRGDDMIYRANGGLFSWIKKKQNNTKNLIKKNRSRIKGTYSYTI